MSYIGNPIISTDFPKDTFSGNGSTTAFTMSIAPASVNAVIVVVSGITQDPSTYTISGTTLTFSAAPPTGTSNISVRHLGVAGTPNVPSDASVTSAKLAAGAALSNIGSSQLSSANMPSGSVLQVVSTVKTDTFGSTSSSDAAITGLSVTITPKATTSKILVIATFNFDTGDTYNARFNLYRNGSQITAYRGDSAGSRALATISYRGLQGGQNTLNNFALGNMTYLDSPATTSATTYQVYCNTNGTIYINRSIDDNNTGDGARTASTITVMEIAG